MGGGLTVPAVMRCVEEGGEVIVVLCPRGVGKSLRVLR